MFMQLFTSTHTRHMTSVVYILLVLNTNCCASEPWLTLEARRTVLLSYISVRKSGETPPSNWSCVELQQKQASGTCAEWEFLTHVWLDCDCRFTPRARNKVYQLTKPPKPTDFGALNLKLRTERVSAGLRSCWDRVTTGRSLVLTGLQIQPS